MHQRRLEWAIRVVYRPEAERPGRYFDGRPADPLDALLHCDETRAAKVLKRSAGWEARETPETCPAGA